MRGQTDDIKQTIPPRDHINSKYIVPLILTRGSMCKNNLFNFRKVLLNFLRNVFK